MKEKRLSDDELKDTIYELRGKMVEQGDYIIDDIIKHYQYLSLPVDIQNKIDVRNKIGDQLGIFEYNLRCRKSNEPEENVMDNSKRTLGDRSGLTTALRLIVEAEEKLKGDVDFDCVKFVSLKLSEARGHVEKYLYSLTKEDHCVFCGSDDLNVGGYNYKSKVVCNKCAANGPLGDDEFGAVRLFRERK